VSERATEETEVGAESMRVQIFLGARDALGLARERLFQALGPDVLRTQWVFTGEALPPAVREAVAAGHVVVYLVAEDLLVPEEATLADLRDLAETTEATRILIVLVAGAEPPKGFAESNMVPLPDPADEDQVTHLAAEIRARALNLTALLPRARLRQMGLTPTVIDIVSELKAPTTAPDVVGWLLRRHTEYGGEQRKAGLDFSLDGFTRRTGSEWLVHVQRALNPDTVGELHGRLMIVGLAVADPALGQRILESGLLTAIEDEIDEDVSTLLTPAAREVRASLGRTSLAGYAPDTPTGTDLLDVEKDAEALAAVLAAQDNEPPLSVGLFGHWGSGKSFFMNLLENQIKHLGTTWPDVYCPPANVVHIRFNAWHYIDANLWASLVAHIFGRLGSHMAAEAKGGRSRELLERLETSKAAFEEQRRASDHATAQIEVASMELERISAERSSAMERLADAAGDESITHDPEIRERAARAAKAVGLPDPDDATLLARETRGGARALARGFRKQPWRWAIGLALVAAGIVLFVAVPGAAGVVTGVLAAAAGVVGEIARRIRPMRELAEAVENAQSRRKQELNVKLDDLRAREQAALRSQKEAAAEVADAQQALEELATGRGMRRFIEERAATDQYKRHLGIIASIQRDFDDLSRLLKPVGEDGKPVPRDADLPDVDRIVLYIDDLDRCPAKNVVEVLQAVHLLLAFPLFVVVVGVDPRWLVRSLSRHHTALLDSEVGESPGAVAPPEDDGGGDDDFGSRPREYLEKIFQIPFALEPMSPDGFGKLVGELMPVRTPAVATQEAPVAEPDGASGNGAHPDRKAAARSDRAGAAGAEAAGSDVDTPEPTRVTPAHLVFETYERDMLRAVAPLIGTPRAAKRLVNVYRFIRARVPSAELRGFVGSENDPGMFRAVVLLLAVLIGAPDEAGKVFDVVRKQPPGSDWAELLTALNDEHELAEVVDSIMLIPLRTEAEPWLPADYPVERFKESLLAVRRFWFDSSGRSQ
jgi:KAP family P-loop domain